ncbi:MAG: alpha/beta hydrolase [Bacteroidaceae bacterium]|nr:alpha/beta hydrolase [Bacteroidaceae bacterium]
MFASLLLFTALIIHPSAQTVSPWAYVDRRAADVCLTPYVAADSAAAPAVIVCPGGSYCWLDVKGEGIEVAQWLQSHGVSAFLLQYRTAGFGAYFTRYRYVARGNRHPDMICDLQRAIRLLRENPGDYGINPDKLGVMGFSAGGHLVMTSGCYYGTDFTDLPDGPAKVSLRPDFIVPVYPVVTMHRPYVHKRSRRGLLGEWGKCSRGLREKMSLEDNVPDDCPPVFLINCEDDPVVDWHNSVLLDSALTVHGIEHRYIRYKEGKHGFGMSDIYGSQESRQWKYAFLDWLDEIGMK